MATTRQFDGLCACGCGERTNLAPRDHKALGWKKGEPYEYVRGHQNEKKRRTFVADPETGCHNWQGQPSQRYPSIKIKGKPVKVHQYFWEQAYGPVPDGLVLHHRCDNPRCCNVEHLEVVTTATNTHHGRAAKLSMEKAEQIRRFRASGLYSNKKLAEMYGVSVATIQNAVYGLRWRPMEFHQAQQPPRRKDD